MASEISMSGEQIPFVAPFARAVECGIVSMPSLSPSLGDFDAWNLPEIVRISMEALYLN